MKLHETDTFKIDINTTISETFATVDEDMRCIGELLEERRTLNRRISQRRMAIKEQYVQLISMVTINSSQFSGSNYKVPLIRIHRAAYDSDLRAAKESVEAVLDSVRIPF